MVVARTIRIVLAPVAGAILLLLGSALVLELPTAQAVAPPSGSAVLALTAPATTPQVSDADAAATLDQDGATQLTRAEFLRELEGSGLLLSEDGRRLLATRAGLGEPRQLVLAQTAFDRFGIVRNPYFDPLRAAVVRDGQAVADLSTGVILGHRIGSSMFGSTEALSDTELEQLRADAGWSYSSAREAEAARYAKLFGGYIPYFLQTDEAYQAYKEAARSNYLSMAA